MTWRSVGVRALDAPYSADACAGDICAVDVGNSCLRVRFGYGGPGTVAVC